MRILTIGFFLTGFFLFLTSCSYKQNQLLFEQRSKLDSSAKKNTDNLNNYQIKPQDVLQIRNLQNINYVINNAPISTSSPTTASGEGSAGQTYQVESDGSVALPVIGRVPVAGLTRQEATMKVETLYRDSLLKDPIIELKIINLKVTILGEIKTQGNYPLVKDKTTLIEMIGEAGGLTEKANEKNIEIIRGGQTNPVITRVNLNNINSLTDPATVLQNDDIIYIAQNKRSARNDNLQSFSILVQPAILVLNTVLLIFTFTHR